MRPPVSAHWKFNPIDRRKSVRLARELDINPLVGELLIQRGIHTSEEARRFLYPTLENLHDPFLFEGMEIAVKRIVEAVKKRQKILIYGDYDVDGITSTFLLFKFLKFMGADVEYYIPHRIRDGYGLQAAQMHEAKKRGVELLLSVDNGTTAFDEVDLIRELGMEIIVTDHHKCNGEKLPNALALLNPKAPNSSYPFKHLCGAGVAFKLALALSESFSPARKMSQEFSDLLVDAMALAAMGTISDVVPLLGENRVLIKFGLPALEDSKSPGLGAILEVVGLREKTLKISDISFKVAPLINAAGRLGDAGICLQLLETHSSTEAYQLSQDLSKQNLKRREMCREIYLQAREQIESNHMDDDPIWVLDSADWHSGLIGVVAAQLVNRFHRPAVLIAHHDNVGKGSARSIFEFSIFQAIKSAGHHLVRYGGHKQAAGFEVEVDNIPAFRESLLKFASENLGREAPRPIRYIDVETEFESISPSLVKDLELFHPYGQNNRKPIFCTHDLQIAGRPRRFGSRNNHLVAYFKKNQTVFKGVGMGKADLLERLQKKGAKFSLMYHPRPSKKGSGSGSGSEIELEIEDVVTNSVTTPANPK